MKKKSKGPPDLPEIGDWCKMRGGNTIGICASVNKDTMWVNVWWQGLPQSRETPKWCHLYELEKVELPI